MPRSNKCEVCGNQIKMMCRTGTGVCGETCEKKAKQEAHDMIYNIKPTEKEN